MQLLDRTPGHLAAVRAARGAGCVNLLLALGAFGFGVWLVDAGVSNHIPLRPAFLFGGSAIAAGLLLVRSWVLLRPRDRDDLRGAGAGLWFGLVAGVLLSLAPVLELAGDLVHGRYGAKTWLEFAMWGAIPLLPTVVNAMALLLFGRAYRGSRTPEPTVE